MNTTVSIRGWTVSLKPSCASQKQQRLNTALGPRRAIGSYNQWVFLGLEFPSGFGFAYLMPEVNFFQQHRGLEQKIIPI